MKVFLFFLLCFSTLAFPTGGGEGHGGGGDLFTQFDLARLRAISLLENLERPPSFKLKTITAWAFRPYLLEVLEELEHMPLSVLRSDQKRLSKEYTLYSHCVWAATKAHASVFLDPNGCRENVSTLEGALQVLTIVALQRLNEPVGIDESKNLAMALSFISRDGRYEVGRNEKTDAMAAYLAFEFRLQRIEKRLKMERTEEHLERYKKGLEEDRRRIVQKLRALPTSQRPEGVGPKMWDWLRVYSSRLADDIQRTPFQVRRKRSFGETPQTSCARTTIAPRALVVFHYEKCLESFPASRVRFETIVHESVHHLGIAEEVDADRVASAVTVFGYDVPMQEMKDRVSLMEKFLPIKKK